MRHIKETSKHLLDELEMVLAQLQDAEFSRPLEIYSGSTIGQHSRHIIEFYQCFLGQIPNGVIDYDLRERNITIELSVANAIEAIRQIQQQLQQLTTDQPLKLKVCFDEKETHGDMVATTISRELVGNIEHAIHHMAIIRIGLKFIGADINIPADFGIAPSTIRYRENTCAH